MLSFMKVVEPIMEIEREKKKINQFSRKSSVCAGSVRLYVSFAGVHNTAHRESRVHLQVLYRRTNTHRLGRALVPYTLCCFYREKTFFRYYSVVLVNYWWFVLIRMSGAMGGFSAQVKVLLHIWKTSNSC